MAKNIVFLLGDPEYQSHITMPKFAKELGRDTGANISVSISSIIPDVPDLPESEFSNLERLADADLMVIYTRFRVLPDRQMGMILSYLDSGRPVVGLKTANHAFRYPEDSPHSEWNLGFGERVLGAPWRTHYGGKYGTEVRTVPSMADSPVLEGVDSTFRVRSWLYHVLPLTELCEPLLIGSTEDPEKDSSTDNPVAWLSSHNGARVFYTSMGHPEDFQVPSFVRLLRNGIAWALET